MLNQYTVNVPYKLLLRNRLIKRQENMHFQSEKILENSIYECKQSMNWQVASASKLPRTKLKNVFFCFFFLPDKCRQFYSL